ncbi:MAG: hypothetical protein BM485_16930 [Desulfobulbaceae bacterium DB1]|nr:MAG: hypothetical protein BM485_16930 [Desulfobulbaceae bacterium DB1]
MPESVKLFKQYPFQKGDKIRIVDGKRHGDWLVADLDEKKVTLRCPVSGREFAWDRFCYFVEERVQSWPEK